MARAGYPHCVLPAAFFFVVHGDRLEEYCALHLPHPRLSSTSPRPPTTSKMVEKRKSQAVANAPVKKRKKAPAKSSKTSKPKRVVDANSLPWKSVELPEMFNDAEGFYGLEEITGVDVVRNGNVVKFVSSLLQPQSPIDLGANMEPGYH